MSNNLIITEKLNRLSDQAREEVNDFIEFLLMKASRTENPDHSDEPLEELGMDHYRIDLTKYEDLLAAGKIKW